MASGIRGYLLIAALVLQVAAPFAAFLGEPPTRFGFQMYSGLGGAVVEVQRDDGESIELDWDSLIAGSLRPELDWTQRLPGYLCNNVLGAATVTVEQTSKQRTVACD